MHRSYTQEQAGSGSCSNATGVHTRVQGVHARTSRFQARGASSTEVQARTVRYRRVEPRPGAYTHVHRPYTPERAGTATWSHVQGRTHTCIGRTRRNGPVQARGATSRSVHTRAMALHAGTCRDRHLEPHPRAYTREHIPYTPERTGRGTWSYVQGRTHACTGRIHPNGPVQKREATSMGVHTSAEGVHTGTGRYRHVERKPGAYTRALRAYTQERSGTVAWSHVHWCKHTRAHTGTGRYRHVEPRPGAHTRVHRDYTPERAGTGTWSHVQVQTPECTGPTAGKGTGTGT